MTTAIYPGSFNPWHKGHQDILEKSLKCFDKVIVAIGYNPEKIIPFQVGQLVETANKVITSDRVEVCSFQGLLVDLAKSSNADAVIRGLRNGHDLQYEMNQQYWNEDLGLTIPVAYFICDRTLSHISSSTIRMVKSLQNG